MEEKREEEIIYREFFSFLPPDSPITFERAKSLGFRLDSNMPEDLLELMSVFSRAVRAQPAVVDSDETQWLVVINGLKL
jgi:hypothetical protein